uniref:FMRFamide-15 n=1 Tax=Sarcophaga bullata TaxID=7385 RepID=FAR15_SARBU|nr:RecName: Full=FMRFamide-15; AltName: Full=SabFMRFamide-15 [Sarcophaga bullata]
THDFMRF